MGGLGGVDMVVGTENAPPKRGGKAKTSSEQAFAMSSSSVSFVSVEVQGPTEKPITCSVVAASVVRREAGLEPFEGSLAGSSVFSLVVARKETRCLVQGSQSAVGRLFTMGVRVKKWDTSFCEESLIVMLMVDVTSTLAVMCIGFMNGADLVEDQCVLLSESRKVRMGKRDSKRKEKVEAVTIQYVGEGSVVSVGETPVKYDSQLHTDIGEND